MKKLTRTEQKKKADRLFSLIVRRRDGECQECGTSQNLQCAHGFSRRYVNTRWDERNAWALCRGCHLKFTVRPLEWDEWMLGRLTQFHYDLLRRRALDTTRKTYVVDVLADLTERAHELGIR